MASRLRAYGIFDGGGIKGAALVGCLAAAQELGIEFAGYGGTSAGSIVALLACLGYTPQEIRDILIKAFAPTSTLLHDLQELRMLGRDFESISRGFGESPRWRRLERTRAWLALSRVARRFTRQLGVCSGDGLWQFLDTLTRAKLKSAPGADGQVTFDDLASSGCNSLKIVAADITHRRAAIFSQYDREHGISVIDAVRASSSYPFAFQPVRLNGCLLMDGALASSLPTFLFNPEYRATGVPTIAFDLRRVADPAPAAAAPPYGVYQFLDDLCATALGASDELLQSASQGVVCIPIEVPGQINVVSFGLPRDRLEQLYDLGYRQAKEHLERLPALQLAATVKSPAKAGVWIDHHGLRQLQPILRAIANDIVACTNAGRIRTDLVIATDGDHELIACQYDSDKGRPSTPESAEPHAPLASGAGRRVLLNGSDWTARVVCRPDVDPDFRTALRIPIVTRWDNAIGRPIALVSFMAHTNASMADSGWTTENDVAAGEPNISPNLASRLKPWMVILEKFVTIPGGEMTVAQSRAECD